jgi:protease I
LIKNTVFKPEKGVIGMLSWYSGIIGGIVAASITLNYTIAKGGNLPMAALEDKKILMVIASNNFRDEEFRTPKKLFEEQGAKVTVASSELSISKGMLGMKVKPDILLDDVEVDNYHAVIFVGGSGASEYWDDSTAHYIAQRAYDKHKLVAAICIAPVTLANAGLLEGKRATVFSSEVSQLKAKGAHYTGKEVERDGRLITANGPQAAAKFGQAIIQALRE